MKYYSGKKNAHHFTQCPVVSEQKIKAREMHGPPSQPWLLIANHCILVEVFFDCDTTNVGTRNGPDRIVGNNLNRIIGVQCIEVNGGETHDGIHDGKRSAF